MKTPIINQRKIGNIYPPYIIAELSANHNGKLQRALDTITQAYKCGADAIKLQTYHADTMTINSYQDDFLIQSGLWKGYKLYDLYKEAHTPFEWHKTLFEHARHIGITCFSTPFDETAVDLLEDLNTHAYKIASFEATDLPLIHYAASTKKPLIISTGLANLTEIEEAIETAKEAGCEQLVLLHCISSYPAPIEQSNLQTITNMQKRFNLPTGLSDHTLSNTAALVAIALGASVIEKHFTLNRNEPGPDAEFSIEPNELESLCQQAKEAWKSVGKAGYELKPAEQENIKFRRSLYFIKDIKAGETITPEHIRRIRPGYGLPPKFEQQLIGQTVTTDIKRGTATSWNLVKRQN